MDEISTYKFLGMHFCFEESSPIITNDFKLDKNDRRILRRLADETRNISEDPINPERKKLWAKNNSLCSQKTMIWHNEVCWHELNNDGELTILTRHPFCRALELEMRQQIYLWKHMPGDMVVEPVMYAPLAIKNTGIGMNRKIDMVKTDSTNDVVSRHYNILIKDIDDIEKIKTPEIIHNKVLSDTILNKYNEIFDGILEVEQRGAPGFWFAPWDDIVTFTGIQEVLLDIALRPDYVKQIINKFVDVGLNVLDQYDKKGLLSRNNYNIRVGSGAYGYSDEIKIPDVKNIGLRPSDLWGCCAAQIFSAVSPSMHEEFALEYEKQWLSRFGMTYYGCCEPLDFKMKQLRTINNLRKISISPFTDIENAVQEIGKDYVISLKPSPAILAAECWEPEYVHAELRKQFEIFKGCNVEIIMKDISTVRYQPQRLWSWTKIASELAEEYRGKV